MIEKTYEVYCDYCGDHIKQYKGKKPTREALERDGFTCTATKVFCNDICWGEWNHDRQERQYINIHPDGKIHNHQ